MKDPRSMTEVSAYCIGKDQLTRSLAVQIAKRTGHGKSSPYRCPNCGHWHVGSRMVRSENMGRKV